MRKAAKVDANHHAIVSALRRCGASVQDLSRVGDGCPDLLVGYHGITYCVEVKDGSKSASRRQLTPDQIDWHARWRGHVVIVESIEDALRMIKAIPTTSRSDEPCPPLLVGSARQR